MAHEPERALVDVWRVEALVHHLTLRYAYVPQSTVPCGMYIYASAGLDGTPTAGQSSRLLCCSCNLMWYSTSTALGYIQDMQVLPPTQLAVQLVQPEGCAVQQCSSAVR